MADAVRLQGLRIEVGDRAVVDDASLTFEAGEIVGLVGASGSGKTLTARALLGLVDLCPGVVRASLAIEVAGHVHRPWDGIVGPSGSSRRRRDAAFADLRGDVLGYLPQDARAALDPLQTVGRQVRSAAALARPASSDVAVWLERAGLTAPDRVARCYPHELSGGMAQRVVIAQALARRSRFLLADEPTTGLDPTVARGILEVFRELAAAGTGIVLVTHDLRVLPGLAERVVVMDAGRTVEDTTSDALVRGDATSAAGRRLVDATRQISGGRLSMAAAR